MKKSIALLAVLGFIIILITLSLSILKIYDKYSSNNYNYISQTSIIIKNISNIINIASKDLNGSNIKQIFNIYPPIISQDENFILNINVTPIFNKININNYFDKNKTNSYIDDTLNNLLDYYEILDPIFFKTLLKRNIHNQKDFQKILDNYLLQKEDKNIYKIPWEKYFFVGNKEKTMLDCNLLDKNLVKFIGLKLKNDIISCNSIQLDENKKIIKNLNIKPFQQNITYWIKISVNFINNGIENNFIMIYDLKSKRVISIEKHFIY